MSNETLVLRESQIRKLLDPASCIRAVEDAFTAYASGRAQLPDVIHLDVPDRKQLGFRLKDLAQIYLMVGDYDEAIDHLEHLLSVPAFFSAPYLKVDPTWNPLRDHPRFQALLEKYG